MVHILIKDIDISKITINETMYTYKISYNLSYLTLIGLSFKLNNISIKELEYNYHIIINDKDTITLLNDIDNLLSKTIPNYIPILKTGIDGKYITFSKNNTVSTILKRYKNNINIHLFKVRKNASYNYPIIYIL